MTDELCFGQFLMSAETKNNKSQDGLRRDAENFLLKRRDVERVLDNLSYGKGCDDATARQIRRQLDDLDCLRFAAWAIVFPDSVMKELLKLELPPASIDSIREFAQKYSLFGKFLMRLHRAESGFENEFTTLVTSPFVFVKSRRVGVQLEIYSHDKILVTATMELDDLLEFSKELIRRLRNTIEYVNKTNAELVSNALEAASIKEFLEVTEKLRAVLPHLGTPDSEAEKPQPS